MRRIDERLGKAKEGHFYERKLALLANEDEIEADFERQVYKVAIIIMHNYINSKFFKQAKAPVKPKTFTVTLNTKFFDCARFLLQ